MLAALTRLSSAQKEMLDLPGRTLARELAGNSTATRRGRRRQTSERAADSFTVPSLASQLAKKYHPDQNKEAGSKEKFVEIQAAYDVRPLLCILRGGRVSEGPQGRLSQSCTVC